MVKVKIFKGDSIEQDFNTWSEGNEVMLQSAQYEAGCLVVFYTERPKAVDPNKIVIAKPRLV